MFLQYPYETKTVTNTMEQLVIAENTLSPLENQTIVAMIERARELVFSFSYPFYVQSDSQEYAELKEKFEKTFCLQYFREQFGTETIGEFRYHLQRILTLNMPYYEQLYKSMTFDYNPLKNHVFERETDMTRNENTSGVTNSESNHKDTVAVDSNTSSQMTNESQSIHSDTPQVNFAGTDYASGMDRGETKSNGTNDTVTNTVNNGEHTGKDTENKDFTADNKDKTSESGFIGSYSDEIAKYRNIIVNINKRICDDCKELFYQMYD